MTVEPEKAQTGSDERGTNHRELAGERIKRDLQIFRDSKISGGVGKQRVGERDRDRAADGETIETVGEIDRIGRADDDDREKDEREPPHVGDDGSLEERQVKRARLHFDQRTGQKNRGDDGREDQLSRPISPDRIPSDFFLVTFK